MATDYKVEGEYTTKFGKLFYVPALLDKTRYDKKAKKFIIDNDNGSFSANVAFLKDSKEAKDIVKFLTKLNKDAHAVFPDEELKQLPLRAITSDSGDELIVLQIATPYDAPLVLDSKAIDVPPSVIDKLGTGSTIRIKFYYHEVEGFGKSGIKLYLKAIQIKDFVEYKMSAIEAIEDDDDDSGFSVEGMNIAPIESTSEFLDDDIPDFTNVPSKSSNRATQFA